VKALNSEPHKARWPEGSQFRPSVKLEMRGKNGIEPADWWHFLNVPDNCAQAELKAWSEQNREHEFRVEP